MSINRTPWKIILFEQLASIIALVIFLVIFISIAPKLLAKSSLFSSEVSTYIYVGTVLISLFGWLYIWLPYTCVRIWKSASLNAQNLVLYLFKSYSLIAFLILVGSAILTLPQLPEIIGQLKLK